MAIGRILGTVFAGTALLGCAADLGSGGWGAGASRQWLCSTDDDVVTCGAPIPAQRGREAYACSTGEARADCPSDDAVAELRDAIPDLEAWSAFAAEPWACLSTGGYERTCVKDLVREFRRRPVDEAPATPEDMRAPSEPGSEEPAPAEATGEFGDLDVEPPTDCSIASWEAFFCDQATVSYRRNGADVRFPCDIFDGTVAFDGDLGGVLSGGGRGAFAGGDPGALGSCGPGELDMRSTAWTRAVEVGCVELNEPILVLCQQAANYAPSTGACAATGTW